MAIAAETAHALLAVGALWGMAVVTPGPNFMVTAKYAVQGSRAESFRAVAGILVATLIWAAAGFLGVHALFVAAPWAYMIMKVGGGGYLMYLGMRMIVRGSTGRYQQQPSSASQRRSSAFRMGVLTTLTNPKSAIFVASVFATALPSRPSFALVSSATLVMLSLSLLWYGAVAVLFATQRIANAYRKSQGKVDQAAGGFFVAFGLKLASGR